MKQFNAIRYFREFKGYSQDYVAIKLHKSQSAYSKIENGTTVISEEIVEQLSKILEVPKEVLQNNEQPVINFNSGSTAKEAIQPEVFYEAGRELLQPFLANVDKLLYQLAEERKHLHHEKLQYQKLQKQLYHLIDKVIDKK